MTARAAVGRARVDDAAALARCHVACWRETYQRLVPAEVLDQLTGDLPERTRRWTAALAGERRTWLALEDPEVVGFASSGPGRDGEAAAVELYALYVRASLYGSGLADRLMEFAVGSGPAFCWVAEQNQRARRYYRRVGFREDGAIKVDDRFGGIREVRMVRPDRTARLGVEK